MGLTISQFDTAAEYHCSLGSSSVGKSGLLALSELRKFPMSMIGPDYTLTMRPRVCVWCARTGEFLYEPTHPRLEEVLVCVLKKWTWINGGVDLPDALTLFYLDFEVEQKPVDDFQCLGDLMLGRPLNITCVCC